MKRLAILVGFLLLLAGEVAAYSGVWPEPYMTPNSGTANNICPAHPTLWASAALYIGKPKIAGDGIRTIAQCIYSTSTEDYNATYADKRVPLDSTHIWYANTGGPCPPDQSADVNTTVFTKNGGVGAGGFSVQNNGGGCNSGPKM